MLMVGVLTYHSFFFLFFFLRNRPIIQGRVMFQKKMLMVGVLTHHSRYSDVQKKMLMAYGWSFDPSFKVQWCSKKNAYGWSFDPSFKVQWCLSSGALLKVVYRLLHPHSIRHVIVNLTTTCLDSFLTKEGNIAMASFYILFVEKMLTNG